MVFYEDPSYRGIATREVVRVGTQAAQLSGTGGGGPGSYDNLIYPEKAVKFLAMRAQVDPGLGVVTQFEEPDGTRSELRYFGPRRVRIFDDQDLDPASVHADTPREVETDGHGQIVQVVETYRGGENNAELRTERTSYAWDALGNLVQLRRHGSASDGSGDIIKTQLYDTIGQKVQIDDLNAGTWTFGYDDAGNLAWHQDPRGNRFAFGYDDGNRLIWEDCVSGPTCGPEVEVRYHYDSPATWKNGEGFFPAGIVDHDGIELPQTHVLGRLAWVEDRGRRTYTSYNARGEVVAQAKNLHGFAMLPDANAPEVLTPMLVGDAELFYVSTRELDDVGRVRHETLVDGTELNYTYDRRGLLATLSGVYQDRALTFVQAVTYDLQGRRVAARLGGGIRETKTYNQMGRTLEVLRVLVDETETTTAEVLHLAYTYDRVGRLTSQTDLRADGLRLDGTSAPTVKTYTYDGQGQLLTSEERTVADDILVRRMRYDYDVLGNIVEKHTTRCVETTSPCTEQDDPPDEYYTHWFGTATYHGDQFVSADGGDGNTLVATYDLAGNMETLAVTRGGQPYFTHTYTWDEQNRLASAVGTGQLFHGGQGVVAVAGYAYDNGGARIAALRAKTFMGVELEETLYVDPSFEIRNGEYTTYVHDAKGRLARLISHGPAAPPDITWLHADHLGSTTVVTSDDGTFIEETKYLPYGAVQSTHRPDLGIPYEPYGFTGKEPERDFGILYFGARYYNPHLARWVSPDPLFLHVTSESAEKSQNVYCYASNNPVNRVDPDGKFDKWISNPIDSLRELGEQAVEAGKIIYDNPSTLWGYTKHVAKGAYQYVKENPEKVALTVAAGALAGVVVYGPLRQAVGAAIYQKVAAFSAAATTVVASSTWLQRVHSYVNNLHRTTASRPAVASQIKEGAQKVAQEVPKIGDTVATHFQQAAGGTGTVWDAVRATQPVYRGTVVPLSFELAAGNIRVWVHGNATEHMAEYATSMLNRGVSRNLVNLASQQQIRSLQAAVQSATANGVPYGRLINVAGGS